MTTRYRKIEQRVWHDNQVIEMSSHQKLFWFYLLTGPYGNRIGLYRLEPMMASVDTGIEIEDVNEHIHDFVQLGLVKWDPTTKLIMITNWLRINGAESPNAASGFLDDVFELPRSFLVRDFLDIIKDGLEVGQPWARHFANHRARVEAPLAEGWPTQEQEQEQS